MRYSHLGANTDWSIGAGPVAPGFGAEYDVPKCGEGVAGCSKGRWLPAASTRRITRAYSASWLASLRSDSWLVALCLKNASPKRAKEQKSKKESRSASQYYARGALVFVPP